MKDFKESAKSKFLEEILEPIIADEENSKYNANYYKEMYTDKFLGIIEQIISERDKKIIEIIQACEGDMCYAAGSIIKKIKELE